MPELLSCPFCGNSAILNIYATPSGKVRCIQVRCDTTKPGWCGAALIEKPEAGGPFLTETEAITAWNRRSPSRRSVLEEAARRFEQAGHDIWSSGEAAEFIRALAEEK